MNIAYFDNAATTHIKPKEMHDFMYNFYQANSVNIGRSSGNFLNEGKRIVEDTREELLSLFYANSDYEAIFTSTATEAINIILQGIDWKKGDYVYISPFEHNAVYRVLKYLQNKFQIEIIILETNKIDLTFNIDTIRYQFSNKRPKMVVVSHVSNVCGNVADIYELGKVTKEFGSYYLIDCAQSAGLLETSIIRCRADYMVFAGHKTLYGPVGCSGFICKRSSAVRPLIYGGTGIDSAREDMPYDLPTRYEAGTQNILSIAGLNASLKWLKKISIDRIREIENVNYNKLHDILRSFSSIEIIGKGIESTSIISCRFNGLSPDIVGQLLAEKGIIVRTGLQCAPLAHKFLGTYPEGTVRFSVSFLDLDYSFLKLEEDLRFIINEV